MTKTLFEFHTGYVPELHGEQYITTCPFCEREDHFFFNKDSNLWDCKICHKNGNPITFIRELYDKFDTLTAATRFLSQLREIPVSAVSLFKPKFNPLNNSYLIPTYRHGKINNLYKVVLIKKQNKTTGLWEEKWTILASPTIDHTVMSWEDDYPQEVWVQEGHWDRMAAQAIIQNLSIGCFGVPGSGVWKPSWCEILAEKDVVFQYDNDPSGRSGFERVIVQFIANSQYKPKSINYVRWPEDKPVGYDMNDCYKEYGRGAINHIRKWIVPYESPKELVVVKSTIESVQADYSCDNFEKLLERYEAVYHTTHSMRLGLLLVISSIYSVKVEGEQIWVRLIGPPSSGKTTLAKCVSGSAQVVLKSTFTGLFSGWKDEKHADKDASLIPLIAGKTLIVKDADALLRQKNVEQIFSELRDFYDKDSSTFYKNMVSHDYRNIRSTMILCGTHVLRRSDQSFLGERFLDFELELSDDDREHIEDRMLRRSTGAEDTQLPPETPVIAAAKGLLDQLFSKNMEVILSPREQNLVKTYARLAATLRTKVDREKFGDKDITFKPVIEVPARLIGQLAKLYRCATFVLGLDKPNNLVHTLIRKVTRDIIDMSSPRTLMCMVLKESYFSRDELAERLKGSVTFNQVTRELLDMTALDLLLAEKHPTGGRNVWKFKLKENLCEALDQIGPQHE